MHVNLSDVGTFKGVHSFFPIPVSLTLRDLAFAATKQAKHTLVSFISRRPILIEYPVLAYAGPYPFFNAIFFHSMPLRNDN